jgi:CIC family chloride channel protein
MAPQFPFHRQIRKFLLALRHKITHRQFFILCSALVGLSAGGVAVAMKFLTHKISTSIELFSQTHHFFWLFSFLPLIGIFLTVLYVKKILSGPFRKGTAEIQYTIAKHSSLLPQSQMYSHVITSMLTVGFGGSTGLESPIVSTGAAIGSNFGRAYTLSYKERTILLACGAAAGIAAAFNAPIAGVLFAIEVVLTDLSFSAFIPLIIAAACGALLSQVVLHEGTILSFKLQQAFNYHNVPFYILLGLLAGLLSHYYIETVTFIQKLIGKLKSAWLKVLYGGLGLALLIMIFPPLFGEGYGTIITLAELKANLLPHESIGTNLIQGEWSLLNFLMLIMLFKSVATGLTLGSGGNGGSFGPSLFMGAYLGFSFAKLVNLTGLSEIPETNFVLVGMAGVLSGVFYAPLSAIFLIAEITGGYELMIPLMIVSALSLAVTKYFHPLSMEAKKLSEKLNHSIATRDHYLLSKLELNRLIETDFVSLKAMDSLQVLVNAVSQSHRNTFPVLSNENELVGLVYLDHVRATIFQTELYQTVLIKDLMTIPEAKISPEENLHDILKKFDEAHQWNLPVIDGNKYIGFVSKARILSKYREELVNTL